MNLVINEDHAAANALFHEIVIEKSRGIFESIMAEEEMGGQVGDLIDEIDAEESGYEGDEGDEYEDSEEEFGDEDHFGDDFDTDAEYDLDNDFGDEEVGEEELEDSVIRIEDKLDQLMREFEEIMGGNAEDDDGDDFGSDDEGDFEDHSEEEFSDDDGDFEEESEEDSEELAEAVQLQKVSVTHGDDGVQKKSPVAANSGKAGMGSKPVNFGSTDEKGRTAPSTKDLKGAGQFKNAPGKKSQDLSAAPKPKHGDDGQNTKSPIAESRRLRNPTVTSKKVAPKRK